ncbi:MAG: methyltransferase domain-containing protein [Chthoniobacterales bacterium]|nr:methyltransferase domain-containing protein [Chthoniobacterales bacterium]
MIRNFEESHPEWMDVAEAVTPELERDLANLESLNRRFGAHKTVLDILTPLLRRGRPVHLLDLGTGAGDIPRAIVARARLLGCPVLVTAVERQQPTVVIAERRSEAFPEIRFVRADMLTFDDGTLYDVVMSNLVLHHLEESDAIRLLRRCRELTRGAALVTDLRRSRLAQAAIFALTGLFYREPMTRHDARLSSERAFSFAEAAKLAVAAGWWGFRHRRQPYFRQSLWMDLTARRR